MEAIAAADFGVAVGDVRAVAGVADAVLPEGVGRLPSLLSLGRRYAAALALSFAAATALKAYALAGGLAGLLPPWLVLALGDDGATLAGVALAAAVLGGAGVKD